MVETYNSIYSLIQKGMSFDDVMLTVRKEMIKRALAEHKNNCRAAADYLRCERSTLISMRRRCGLPVAIPNSLRNQKKEGRGF